MEKDRKLIRKMIMTRITNWEMWHLDYFLAFIASLGKSLHLYILGLGLTDVGIDIKSLHRESLQLSPQFLTMVVWFTCSVLFLKCSELLSHSLRHTKLLLIRYIVPVCEYDWLNNSNIRVAFINKQTKLFFLNIIYPPLISWWFILNLE